MTSFHKNWTDIDVNINKSREKMPIPGWQRNIA